MFQRVLYEFHNEFHNAEIRVVKISSLLKMEIKGLNHELNGFYLQK